jgi:hypothetical protein
MGERKKNRVGYVLGLLPFLILIAQLTNKGDGQVLFKMYRDDELV